MTENRPPTPREVQLNDILGRNLGAPLKIIWRPDEEFFPNHILTPQEAEIDGRKITFSVATHTGLKRKENQDAYNMEVIDLPWIKIIYGVVTDGIGGQYNGKIASQLVSRGNYTSPNENYKGISFGTALRVLLKQPENQQYSIDNFIREAIGTSNLALIDSNLKHGNIDSGTTLTGFLLAKRINQELEGYIFNVGDSRTYLYDTTNSMLESKTIDHKVVTDILKLTPEQAKVHPKRHDISRSIGSKNYWKPDIFPIKLVKGDILYLCTDGISDVIPDIMIQHVLLESHIIEDRVNTMAISTNSVKHALLQGGPDNITAMTVAIE